MTDSQTPKRTLWRRAVMTAAGVLGLAAVIFGVAAVSEPAKRTPPVTGLSAAEEADRLAADAAEALSAEDTSTAVRLAEQALAADSSNRTAQRVRAAAGEPQSDPDTPNASPADAPDPYAAVVTDASKLLPLKMRDWVRGREVVQAGEALVTFEPRVGGDDFDAAVRVLILSHDRGSSTGARRFVADVTKVAFPHAGKAVKVGDIPDGYAGQDVSQQVVVAFARGRYAFELIVTPQPGSDPKKTAKLALDLAARHPAATR